MTGCHPLREDVSWNASLLTSASTEDSHPLREDVSWNVTVSTIVLRPFTSSSSWGCELKCWPRRLFPPQSRHPLREDVSWNVPLSFLRLLPWGHPLREDVSWNIQWESWWITCGVILFVRMWVEMFCFVQCWACRIVILFVRMWVEIIFYTDGACSGNRHPLREDVSWNTWWRTRKPNRRVILFVRMWVEILSSVFWTLQC